MFDSLLQKILLFILLFGVFHSSHAQPVAKTYTMPASLIKQLKAETEQRQRGDCEKQPEFSIKNFYTINNKLLLLIGLPDYFCSASSFMPVTIDNQGQWQAGAVIESYPLEMLVDNSKQFWLISHWEIEGVFPLLHHSSDGLHWQEISLPNPEKIECCFHYLKQLCINGQTIQIKLTGLDDMPVEYWQSSTSDSLTATPHWKKLTSAPINSKQCQSSPLPSGDWQQQLAGNGQEIWLQSSLQGIKVVMPRWLK